MHFHSKLLTAIFVTLLSLQPQVSSAQDISRVISLGTLATSDPVLALQQADDALRDPSIIGNPPDLRLVLDLLRLRAELLEQLGNGLAGGDGWAEYARLSASTRPSLGIDPVPAFEKAAALYEVDAAYEQARRMIELAIEAEIETGRTGEKLVALNTILVRLATAEGRIDLAEAAQEIIDSGGELPLFETQIDEKKPGFRAVEVYYATDRARSGDPRAEHFYGIERGDRIELGVATVTIPDTHTPGQIERPSVWRLEFSTSPTKHVVLQDVAPVDPGTFFGRLQGEFEENSERDLFVFVHGYNTGFVKAATRTAQMAHDMGNSVVPVLFSWPSRDSTVGYIADAAVVRLSGRRLAVFLEDLAQRSGARTIHLVGHSMGNRALTDALEILALRRNAQPGDEPVFGQVMFAAPDVDAQLFAKMAQVFRPLAKRLTLYASSSDWALVSSRKLHGSAPRAGLGGSVLVAADAFDSIDMSALGADMLAHEYFADDSSALADIMTLFWQDAPPERRCGLAPRNKGNSVVWDYQAGACASNDLIGAIVNLRNENARSRDEMRVIVSSLMSERNRVEHVLSVLERVLTD